jgi:hypothetical protein
MARDSQAALVALNHFGLGARGGASGDFLNAASDPRGFVKAELARPNGGQHNESAADVIRDRRLTENGYRVLRF